jgi:hypothetical protein
MCTVDHKATVRFDIACIGCRLQVEVDRLAEEGLSQTHFYL